MLVDGQSFQTVWAVTEGTARVRIIDQRLLPWKFEVVDLNSVEEVAIAIKDMWVRGAGCIGATAGFGMWLAAMEAAGEEDFARGLKSRADRLRGTRPTAVNLAYAVDRQLRAIGEVADREVAVRVSLETALAIAEEDVAACQAIGEHGLKVIEELSRAKNGGVVNLLTHCNAGWLAFVDHGSATAPIYAAQRAGIAVHVWVDETRPRNQGARLTAWELAQQGVPHTVICDNTGGHLMQHGMVDMVITGADRVSCQGDVANKIGTYLKALAARDNGVPFYVALPSSTIDWNLRDGVRDIPIEQRGDEEVRMMEGWSASSNEVGEVTLFPAQSAAANYAFDVTPARLVTGLITEAGICAAAEEALLSLHQIS
ncbi:S-methyl-5-thioribose-1-phosphate isomerase [Phragmitibacter flavus]|uniref:Methylthioribose-1-phosphate isomerase n=1 Tax=Phragmitibacter flavus TaxID=2576071 RepID=A0A5R8KFV0_9BACT|nr:S-methyl-5-thioribose-1-phosphate isomerase [Phragmitibacter flavus]TLD71177.1 S-methyl-5-thioribose-1-phosphate isomerase [Phragmitibacter flavus]